MMELSRRHFLRSAAAVSLGFTGLQTLLGCSRETTTVSRMPSGSESGRALPGPLESDPQGMLDLPRGFHYHVISRVGDEMEGGLLVPGKPDGMAAFPGAPGKTIVIRNHELLDAHAGISAFGSKNERLTDALRRRIYDAGAEGTPCLGGTTTFVFNHRTNRLERQFLSLGGTVRNCAGGPTPWNSWITCEETELKEGQAGSARHHGYNFEVPARPDGRLADPAPIKDMGRFSHEAVAVHPETGIIYQTEDQHDGLIYRFIPNTPGVLSTGGRLQALVIREARGLDTRNWDKPHKVSVGDLFDVAWMDLEEIDSPNGDLRYRGHAAGAAVFARGEGMWYGNDAVYFACTNGGNKKKGQIWKYTPSQHEGTSLQEKHPGKLELFVEPNDGDVVENADNLTVAPWGDLVVCEDGPSDNFLLGITPKGEVYKLARNAVSHSEMAGVTFSPDGSTLFVNIQHDGLTLAIQGPWRASSRFSLGAG